MPEDETSDDYTVVCPWCEHKHSDAFEMVDYSSEDWVEGKCDRCSKSIQYRVVVSHTYVCEPIFDDDEIDAVDASTAMTDYNANGGASLSELNAELQKQSN